MTPRLTEEDALTTLATAGLEATDPYPGNTKTPWLCRCLRCDREVKPRLNDLRHGRGGCRKCGHKATEDKQRLSEEDALTALAAAGLAPVGPYPGNTKTPWPCRCLRCSSEGRPTLHDLRRGRGGCQACATHGFNPSKPAWVYLLERPADRIRQYGVTGHPTIRLSQHRKAGFTVVLELLPCVDGQFAWEIEGNIKARLKARGVGPACRRREFNGWTETFPAAAAPDLRPSDFAPEIVRG